MYAIIQTGGKQYRVQPGDVLEFDRLQEVPADNTVTFTEVVAVAAADGLKIGSPLLTGATVTATLVTHFRGDKLIIFKMKRRKRYRRMNGFRAELSKVRILDIKLNGQVVASAAAPATAAV